MTIADTFLSQIIKDTFDKFFGVNSVWVSLRFDWKLLDSKDINLVLDF